MYSTSLHLKLDLKDFDGSDLARLKREPSRVGGRNNFEPHPLCFVIFSSLSLLYFSSSFRNWAFGFLEEQKELSLHFH